MSYITSKKSFPVAMIGFPLTEKAIKRKRCETITVLALAGVAQSCD